MENWFLIRQIDDKTYVISEPDHWEETNCYLLVGTNRALLIDTGLGIYDISKEVSKITDKPIIAVPTHVHWDHIGGLFNFPNFYVHKLEREWIEEKFPLSTEFVRKMLVNGYNLTDSGNVDNYRIFQGKPRGLLCDGDIIDIGGREIRILHTPGHSPGHICFFEEKTGYLFTGDLIYKGTLFANYESTDPEKYLDSIKKISKLPVKKIFPAHHSFDISSELIFSISEGLSELKKQGKLSHGSGLFEFNEWKILL